MYLIIAFALGFVSGLRTFTSLAAVSWAARQGLMALSGTPLAFMGFKYTPIIFTIAAIGELIVDKLPSTPSRKAPPGFIGRIVSGCLVGASAGAVSGSIIIGLIAGAVGAVAGTLGGSALRARMAAIFGKDVPAALLEDALAIVLAVVLVTRF